jgi:hypothetical protein
MPMEEEVAALETMSVAQLKVEWRRVIKSPPPEAFSPDLMARAIAHELQSRQLGRLSRSAERELRKLVERVEQGEDIGASSDVRIKAGTRLVRDWGGRTHHVLVMEQGYIYADREYRSLSQIATLITGARWSGPRFFGLKGRGQSPGQEAA